MFAVRMKPRLFGTFAQEGRIGQAARRLSLLLFGERVDDTALSYRVRLGLERQQAASEIIVGWIQAAVIAFFAVVYATSPKAFPAGTRFEPVPLTLAVYAAFTATRIFLAHRGRLRHGLVALSVVVDIAALMIVIWSFHLQYQAPPALYLKAPTLMYVFIFIALRALRFEPRYVLLAGGCAALGWLFLFVYAAREANGAVFTHSYVDYVTSYKILRGAEIDKILSILIVTGILALSVFRARRCLVSSLAEHVAAADFSRFFVPEVARQIRRGDSDPTAGQGERRQAAILFVDIRGFTSLSSHMTAPELIALLGEYHARIVPVIERHGGSIDKYLGDGILASFGAVSPATRYAADLCRAIEEVAAIACAWQREREGSGAPAPMIVAAGAVGEVVFGTVGYETRLEYTVVGEVVNLVAKLEKHTRCEEVRALTTLPSFELAISQGYRPQGCIENRPGRFVEGVDAPVDLAVLAP
jgi:adenylate cyclase